MTAAEIINRLVGDRCRRNLVMPNFTPRGWWECDVFELSKAGYFREYEVKVSRADLFADRRKVQTQWVKKKEPDPVRPWQTHDAVERTKFDRLSVGDPGGPSQFWYVTPAGLVEVAELPTWAGLIIFAPNSSGNWWPTVVRKAPKLHTQKADATLGDQAKTCAYWRFHELRARAFRQVRLAGTAQPE